MQLRKLIRLLEEAKKIHGDRIEVYIDCDDARKLDHLSYLRISSVRNEICTLEDSDGREDEILVVGAI